MASLGLKPLSKKAERKLRDRLGFALAMWEEPYSAVEVKDIVSSLKSHAKRLDKFAPLAAVAKGGFSRSDEIEVACRLAQILSEAKRLQLTKGKSRRSPYDWYDEFAAVLLDVCKHNNIEPTVAIDRSSDEPVGGLAEVASGFERLLLPKMRSRTPSAMVKRLQRSLARLEQRLRAAPR
jgi:hypothetical protein